MSSGRVSFRTSFICQSDGPTRLDITRYRVSGLTTNAVKTGDSKIATNAAINAASDLIGAAAALTDAVAEGEVTPGEAASLSMLVGNVAKAIETIELAERLAKLEEHMAAKG
jgi:hypothetical protein